MSSTLPATPEEALGTWSALVVTVVLFGPVHLGNPNATLYGAAAIGIEAGMLLGVAYVLTRRLWLAIGIHFGWNFMQAGVFGPTLSGVQVGSLLESELRGPDLLSGGALRGGGLPVRRHPVPAGEPRPAGSGAARRVFHPTALPALAAADVR